LEELLAAYEGTLLLVSHDRTFLDNVVTSTLVFEGEGKFLEYAGGYEDWERYQRQIPAANSRAQRTAAAVAVPVKARSSEKRRRLSYKEQRELDELPAKIEALEGEQVELHVRMGSGDFYRQSSDKIAAAVERLGAVKCELELHYERWQILDSIAGEAATD
jgi:ATP-binding cassette subfamily F protein uup